MSQVKGASRGCAAWPVDALRIGFGLIWLIDAALKWLPGFRAGYMDTIMGEAQGQPGWLRPWFDFWINVQHPQTAFFAWLVAVVETLIAVALIAGFARKATYIAAIAFSLLIWATAEGFGGPYTSGASDIGTAVIYAVVFAALLALSHHTGPSRYTADYYLEQKYSWWWKVAETRRPAPRRGSGSGRHHPGRRTRQHPRRTAAAGLSAPGTCRIPAIDHREGVSVMTRRRITVLISAAVAAAAGLGAGLAAAASGSAAPAPAATAAAAPGSPPYSYYRSMMSSYYGGSAMMSGSGGYQQMMGTAGYRWMFGGASVPGWMRGAVMPGAMMGASADPGQFMGQLWANAPGPRVSPGQAAQLGGQVPAGARVDRAANTLTFTTATVELTVLASPSGGPDETFHAAGLVNPAIIVPAGAQVSIQVVNADSGTAHGLVITGSSDVSSWMPMMTARPAFAGSAVWFLGNPTAAGMHAGTLTFTASSPGTYRYLCPVPGHAQKGMTGRFTVR